MQSGKTRILIVDDNIGLDKTMSFVLQRKGYDVTCAANGMEALEKSRNTQFDMIFMDIQMPVMNGVETLKRIREIQPNAAVVMMTAYAVEDLVKEALEAGAYAILYKPVDVDELIEMIENARIEKRGSLILVVDDDPGMCAVLAKILNAKGHKVATAHTGEEAIALERAERYEIILIDMKLPTINGLETYLALKEINPEAVAVIMTAYREEMDDLVKAALNSSAYACIYKPIDIGRLLTLIGEIKATKAALRK